MLNHFSQLKFLRPTHLAFLFLPCLVVIEIEMNSLNYLKCDQMGNNFSLTVFLLAELYDRLLFHRVCSVQK